MISKLVRRNIAATKGRLFLMLLSVVLGVSFVSGSFLLADSLRAIFADISTTALAGVDGQVRVADDELSVGFNPVRFSDETVAAVAALPEVELAAPMLTAAFNVYTLDSEGEQNAPQGPPVFVMAWGGESDVSPFLIQDGERPRGDQIAIDDVQAEAEGFAVGDMIQVSGDGLDEFLTVEVSAIVAFGDQGIGGAYFNLFDLETTQRLTGAGAGLIDGIALNRDDAFSNAEMLAAVEAAIASDPSLEVVSGVTVADEQTAEFNSFIDIFGYVLLGFALVVLFVSTFIIYNTFAILISQRIRQFGLLRSIGATGGQLMRMVLIEALIIGVIASIVGLLGGLGIAEGLKWAFSQGGGEFPDGPTIFRARTIIIVFSLGIGITVLSALLPAIVANRIPALAALRDGADQAGGSRLRRFITAGTLLLIACVLLGLGLFRSAMETTPRLVALGFGSIALFLAVALGSQFFAAAVTRIIGTPVASLGLNGRLARGNASRNPQRTAATASALMVGLALITGVLVLTQSLRASFETLLDEAVAADLFVYEENQGIPFAGTSVDRLRALPEISDAAGVAELRVEFNGEAVGAAGFDLATENRVLDPQLSEGTFAAGDTGVLLHREEAEELGLALGDSVTFGFEDGFVSDFEIVGIFDDKAIFDSDWILDRRVTVEHQNQNAVQFVGATIADGVSLEAGQAAAESAVSVFPQLVVENNAEFKETQEGQINSILILVFLLLGLCIVVAFIGIVNTMALSILERTREIGLLRAVGTTRPQLRSMVRWEAVIVGVFGAILGVALGLVIGIAAVTAIPDSFIGEVAIPWLWAIGFMLLGGLLGVIAAFFPANRAANMNVLDAISTV